jgi:hypothetical protein
MSNTALNLTHAATRDFLERNKNLLALTREGTHKVMKRLEAALTLMNEADKGDVLLYLDTIDQPGFAGKIGREDFQNAMYVALCKAFLKAQRNFVILFATKLTPEALAELDSIEVAAGERQPAPPRPPQKSQAELVEDQVRHDWNHLPTGKIKIKLSRDREYKAVFDRLMAADELKSSCTSLHDARVEQR